MRVEYDVTQAFVVIFLLQIGCHGLTRSVLILIRSLGQRLVIELIYGIQFLETSRQMIKVAISFDRLDKLGTRVFSKEESRLVFLLNCKMWLINYILSKEEGRYVAILALHKGVTR